MGAASQPSLPDRGRGLRALGNAAGGLLALAMLVWVFRGVDTSAVTSALARAGGWAALAAVPFGVGLMVDTVAWRGLMLRVGRRAGYLRLLQVRIATESAVVGLAGGAVLAEGLAPLLLFRSGHATVGEGAATVAIRKLALLLSQGIYVGLAAILGGGAVAVLSEAMGWPRLGPWLLVLAGLLICLAALALQSLLRDGTVGRIHRLVERVRWAPVQRLLERSEVGVAQADQCLAQARDGLGPAAAILLAVWFLEAGETWLILWLVGIDLPFTAVMAFEPLVALARHAMFFLPAGLGIQDAGYVASLGALGVSDPLASGAAFTVLKRAKELAWVLFGALLMAWLFRTKELSEA